MDRLLIVRAPVDLLGAIELFRRRPVAERRIAFIRVDGTSASPSASWRRSSKPAAPNPITIRWRGGCLPRRADGWRDDAPTHWAVAVVINCEAALGRLSRQWR